MSDFSRFGGNLLVAALVLLTAKWGTCAEQPKPAAADVSYGPSPIELLDVYIPSTGTGPFPVLIWFGGIWKPAKHAPDPNKFLSQGCAVVAVQTGTMSAPRPTNGDPPISIVLNSAVRSVQFVRLNAAKWNLDPNRIAVGGGSQGALPALYIGTAGDRANPQSTDSVERVSTEVLCVGAYRSQPSIDPQRMQQWVPGVKWGAPALGCTFEESLKRRDELLPIINRWSPDALLNKDTPPIYFENNWPLTRPESVQEADYKVHSPAWSLGFQKLAQAQGVPCYVKYPDHPTARYKDVWDFLIQEMKSPAH